MTKNFKLLKLFYVFTLVMISATFTSCVDDNDDTQAPYLEVSPTTLTFDSSGQPLSDSQNSFQISTNRSWTATVQEGKTWVTLSKSEGEGSAVVQVSIPQGINDEASVLIQISNKVGILMSQTVVIKSGTVSPVVSIFAETTGSQAVSSPYPLAGAYTDWGTSGEGASSVTFSGVNASIRASGLANTGSYPDASGPNIVFFGTAPSSLTVNTISLTSSQTNLHLTFGASYSLKNDDGTYDNIFNPDNFIVELSGDGSTWTPVTYTKNDGDQESPYWIQATADFTLTQSVDNLYIRFTASVSSAIRLDDIILTTGTGGQSIDLSQGTGGGGGTTESKAITIADLISMMTTTQTTIDAEFDRTFEAVVQNDTVGDNYSFNNLVLSTPGANTAGNGITLYGSSVEPTTLGVNKGDLVKVTLIKDLAKVVNYNGLYEVTGSKDVTWVTVQKVGTATITPAVITPSQLASFQGMAVTVQNATPSQAGVWATATALSKHTFSADATDFTVFIKKNALPFVEVPFEIKSGSISGIASVNSNVAQLVPRNLSDVSAFTVSGSGGGDTGGGTVTNPFTMTAANISSTATGAALTVNGYGSQSVADPATWYTWNYNAIDFTGVKMCIATDANGGGIQLQGNATDATKQGRIANVTALNIIQQIVITLRVVSTSTYAPSYTLYAGNDANPDTNIITPTVVESVDGNFKKYVETYDLSNNSFSFFNIMNNKAGALYIDSIEIKTL